MLPEFFKYFRLWFAFSIKLHHQLDFYSDRHGVK